MDVVCGQCKTEYEFDDAQVGESGVTVKCTECGYSFVVKPESPHVIKQRVGTPALGSAIGWMLRTVDGGIYPLSDLSTLERWIVDRQVTRQDEISRTGQSWKRLGEMPELVTFFEAQGNARNRLGPRPKTAGYGSRDSEAMASAPRTFTPAVRPAPKAAAKAAAPSLSASATDWTAPDDPSLVIPRRSAPRWIWMVSVGVVSAVGLAFAAVRFFPKKPVASESDKVAYEQAWSALEQDTEAAWQETERAFSALRSGAEETRALAGLAHLRASQAQAALDEAAALERQNQMQPASDRRRLAQVQAAEARLLAEQALNKEAENGLAQSAAADALRLAGSSATQVEDALRRARQADPHAAAALYVEGALRLDQDKVVLARDLLLEAARRYEEATHHPSMRMEFRLAILELQDGKPDAARERLERIAKTEPKHTRARALLDEMKPPVQAAAVVQAESAPPSVATESPHQESGAGDRPPPAESYKDLLREADRLSESDRTAQAAKLYRKALALQRGSAAALVGLGYCELDANRGQAAVTLFEQALQSDGSYGDALIGSAEAYKLLGNLKQALHFYQRYLAAHPDGSKARMAQNNVNDLERRVPKAAPVVPPTPPTEDSASPAAPP